MKAPALALVAVLSSCGPPPPTQEEEKHHECCQCLADLQCLGGPEERCETNLNEGAGIRAEGVCVSDDSRCGHFCSFLSAK